VSRPSAFELWVQAGEDPERYRALLREHNLILSPGDEGYEQGSRTLPCGYPGPSKPAAEWCIHELAPGTCSVCTGRGEEIESKPDPADFGPWFTSRYAGKCAGCGEQWPAGDRIRADGSGGYLCEPCGGAA
jgi:hypothetical protein